MWRRGLAPQTLLWSSQSGAARRRGRQPPVLQPGAGEEEEEEADGEEDALLGEVMAAARGLRPLLRHLPAVRGAGLLQHRAAGGGESAARGGGSEAGLPEPQLRQRRGARPLPAARAHRQQVRRVGPEELLRGLQLGPGLGHVLRQHAGHHRGLWPHHPSVRLWEGLLHPLRSDRSPLHHAGAYRLCAEAHVPAGPRSRRPPEARGPAAAPGHGASLPVAAAPSGAVLLRGAGGGVQRAGGDVVVPGRRILLLHLSVHHWPWRLRAGDAAGAGVQAGVPGVRHGLPVCGPDDDVPAAAHPPQNGRLARSDNVPAAAALRGVGPGRGQGAHCGAQATKPGAAVPDGHGRQRAPGAKLAGLVQHHQQRLNGVEADAGTKQPLYLCRALRDGRLDLNSSLNFFPFFYFPSSLF